jgi:hypothetical protein
VPSRLLLRGGFCVQKCSILILDWRGQGQERLLGRQSRVAECAPIRSKKERNTMRMSIRALQVLTLFVLLGLPMYSQNENSKPPSQTPEIVPRRPECGLFLPARDERRDIARLVRAEQFLDCERDGFPRDLAPPWKTSEEGEKKLGAACEYFAVKSVREYPQAGRESLQLASDRCHINVMQIILMKMVEGAGSSPR